MNRRDPDRVCCWTAFFGGWLVIAGVGAYTGWLWETWHPFALGVGGLAGALVLHCVVLLADPEDPAHKE